jgi:hypothetical protein
MVRPTFQCLFPSQELLRFNAHFNAVFSLLLLLSQHNFIISPHLASLEALRQGQLNIELVTILGQKTHHNLCCSAMGWYGVLKKTICNFLLPWFFAFQMIFGGLDNWN